jgi:hypothetical protein
MAHWAEIDENNIVIRVLVGDNNDPAGDEGYSWLINNLGGNWIKTSYNGNIRYNYAGIGYIYDEAADAFYAPNPNCGHPELVLNDQYRWECQECERLINEALAE